MQTSLLPRRKSTRRVSFWPDTAPLAGIALLLVLFYMLAGIPKFTAGPSVDVPHSSPDCCSDPPAPTVFITINRAGHFFIAGSQQAEIVQQLAKQYGMLLSTSEYQKLVGLPYLATSVTDLPAYLALTPADRYIALPASLRLGMPFSQVIDYIKTAREMNRSSFSCCLRVDQDLPYSGLKQLLDKLNEQDIRHFQLVTELNSYRPVTSYSY